MVIKLLIFIKDRWTWMGSSGNVDLNCSLWIWSWALQVSQWAQGLWNFDIIDFAYYKSCWFVCACQAVKDFSLCGKTLIFSVQQSSLNISLLDHCSINIFCQHDWILQSILEGILCLPAKHAFCWFGIFRLWM